MNIPFKRLHKDAQIPKLMTAGAGCADLVATKISRSSSDEITVFLGFATEIPEGYKMCISPRSSFTQKGWVMQNSPGQIDSDYRGEWMLKFQAIPEKLNDSMVGFLQNDNKYPSIEFDYPNFPYKVGDRVAQCWLEKVINFEFEETDNLSETERNTGGFGSTNIKA